MQCVMIMVGTLTSRITDNIMIGIFDDLHN